MHLRSGRFPKMAKPPSHNATNNNNNISNANSNASTPGNQKNRSSAGLKMGRTESV
jgi:hypothetical protein